MLSRSEGFKIWKWIAVLIYEISYGRPKSNRVTTICDGESLEKKKEAFEQAELMFGVDFTQSNDQTGQISFKGDSLHLIREGILNPYQHVMTVFARIFPFLLDKNRSIACYRFGDATTRDDGVLSFNPANKPCVGIDEALAQYVKIVPGLYLAEPKSFAPIINMAISTVKQKQNQGKQHVLVIISNGPVHRDRYTELGKLSCQEQKTVDAIENARDYSLSIILIGVGDNSGDMMRFFKDNISPRAFENFQVVNFTNIMSQEVPESRKDMDFALALMKKLRFP
ncbi:hypothetical protein MKX03_014505 [Papaver bracteatum]|nr:hypothetical protein MKX03_014505 [Papaver bracteatum]